MLEEVAILVRFFSLLVDQRDHGSDLVEPDVFLQHEILILADLLDLSQDIRPEDLVKLLLGVTVPIDDILPFLLILIDLQLILNTLAIILKVFSGLIDALEEVHHIPESDIDLHFVHILEDFCGFDLALDLEGDLWPIHA